MRSFAHGDVLEMDGEGDVPGSITVFRPKLQELWDSIADGINAL